MPRFQIQIIFLQYYERLLHRLQYITKAQKQEQQITQITIKGEMCAVTKGA